MTDDILLENIFSRLAEGDITETQALYLIGLRAQITVEISAEGVLDLVEKKYIKSGRVAKVLLTAYNKDDTLSGTIKPLYKLEYSREVVKKLCKLLCVMVKGTNKILLPGGNGESVKFTATTYMQGEGLIAYHYLIMLFMFPVQGETNKRWEKHFSGFKYKGPKLRVRSRTSGKTFTKLAKKEDMGALLYGTYLYIQSAVTGNKAFITTLPKFLELHEDWYHEAYGIIENVKSDKDFEKLFKRDGEGNQQDELNIMI